MHLFFSTPVWISEIENFETINKELTDFIYKEKNDDPAGKTKSNVKGWHSKQFDLQNESLKKFLESLSSKIRQATIDMGWASVDKLKKVLSKENPINIKYVDSSEIKITDYFDIAQNSWSNNGVSNALDRAVDMCKQL